LSDVVFVDLDGTYIHGNSFHLWLSHLVLGDSRVGIAVRLSIFVMVMLRAVRAISHSRLKQAVQQQLSSTATRSERSGAYFPGRLRRAVVPAVREGCLGCRDLGYRLVLATAAPAEYAVPFATLEGFDDCLATEFIQPAGWRELYRSVKAEACGKMLRSSGTGQRQVGVVTDHLDDLPLMKLADWVVWCGEPALLPGLRLQLEGTVLTAETWHPSLHGME
jgi:phosphoserine phosphatase